MADKVSFPGAEAMTQAIEHFRRNTEEFSRMFTEMKFPVATNADAWMAAHKRNVEALTQANKVALEGAQAVAKRHMEIIQQTFAEMSETMSSLTATEAPQERATKQAEMLKGSYERALSHLKELGELIQNTNSEAVKLLNERFVEAMAEVKTLVAKES